MHYHHVETCLHTANIVINHHIQTSLQTTNNTLDGIEVQSAMTELELKSTREQLKNTQASLT